MRDILKQMGVKQARVIDSDLGFELCRREGIKAIAIGSFTKAGDVFRTDLKFLDLWKDADPGRPEVEDAKARLAALKSS